MAQVAQLRTQEQRYLITWDSQGKQTNPDDTTVMADTDVIATVGDFRAVCTLGASVVATWLVQHRNADNDASIVDDLLIYTRAGESLQFEWLVTTTAVSQRVRVMMEAAITGTAAASISLEAR